MQYLSTKLFIWNTSKRFPLTIQAAISEIYVAKHTAYLKSVGERILQSFPLPRLNISVSSLK